MPHVTMPASVALQNSGYFLRTCDFFDASEEKAILEFQPKYGHIEPFGLVMLSAWGAWCRRNGILLELRNVGPKVDYMWRMHLFDHLGVKYTPKRTEWEESGRFLPVMNVRNGADVRHVIAGISTLLHLQGNPESLNAVQHSVSELLRNVIEHSGSPDGAFICAQNFSNSSTPRVTIAVADCGVGIQQHLSRKFGAVANDDVSALNLAMRPGVTGALPGAYGGAENAGAGLFITRSIAKGSGGYFLLLSGSACYRLRRALDDEEQSQLNLDPTADRHDMWQLPHAWQGTVVSMEIRTDQIADYEGYIAWIRKYVPERADVTNRIRFT